MATSGFLWTPYTTLRTVISQCDTFQTWTGAADAAAALPFIYLFEDRDNIDAIVRVAVILPHPIQLVRDAQGSGIGAFSQVVGAKFGFLEKVDAYSEAAATDFLNNVGAILADILGKPDTARYKRVDEVDWKEAPLRWAKGELKGYQKYFTAESAT